MNLKQVNTLDIEQVRKILHQTAVAGTIQPIKLRLSFSTGVNA